jgi:hypothetical protein
MNTKLDAKKYCNAMAGVVGSVVEGTHCMFTTSSFAHAKAAPTTPATSLLFVYEITSWFILTNA